MVTNTLDRNGPNTNLTLSFSSSRFNWMLRLFGIAAGIG